MTIKVWQKHSLKTRVTLFTLLIFLLGIWSLAFYSVGMLRADMQALLSRQQFSVVSLVAADVEQQVSLRQRTLQQFASQISPALMANPKDLQLRLSSEAVLQSLFNGGSFVTGSDGVATASFPVEAQRVGVSYRDRDYIQEAFERREPSVGKPVMGRALGSPIVAMAVPIVGADGQAIGVLAGIINLGRPNFLDRISASNYGRDGSYLLIDKHSRTVVTASDKRRVLEQMPPSGTIVAIDRFLEGFEGSQVFVNALGQEVLSSVRQVPSADWMVAVNLPTEEAFAPLHAQVIRMLLATGLVSMLAAAAVWWMMRNQLEPLQTTARRLWELSGLEEAPPPLPVTRQDEVGTLIASFNRLLDGLAQQQRSLKENEERYRTVFRTSPNAVTITRLTDGVFLDVNDGFEKLTGWPRELVIGKNSVELRLWESEEQRLSWRLVMEESGSCRDMEIQLLGRDGRRLLTVMSADRITINGEPCLLAVTQNVTEQRAVQDQLEHLAFSDPLTDLPNRRLLMDRIGQAMLSSVRHHTRCALLHLDLDDFKTVNETLGHDLGDILLQQVARRLAYTVREVDTVARLGADEFVVLLEDLDGNADHSAAQAEAVGEKLLSALNQPYHMDGAEHFSSCSIGITLFGDRTEGAMEPLKRAELAMYEAKGAGRNKLRFFDPAMQAVVSARVALEAGLREAIERNYFLLHYQAQWTDGRQITGAEVLLRWRDPLRGMVSPAEFIPIAEETGLILPIGHWVLQTACEQLAQWARRPELAHLTIAVNVSARQFRQEGFVAEVLELLERSGAPPQRLKVELTESMLVTDVASVIEKMRALKQRGVGFSLDDFGTGYSSLSYLKRLPLDQLKIDQGFVRDILVDADDAAIAKTVIALADSLGLNVIAEGVETQAQRERLASLGCHSYQGYLIGRPVTVDVLETMVLQAQVSNVTGDGTGNA